MSVQTVHSHSSNSMALPLSFCFALSAVYINTNYKGSILAFAICCYRYWSENWGDCTAKILLTATVWCY